MEEKVIILGFAPDTRELAPLDDDSFEVWALNELYADMPRLRSRADRWFQLHGFEPPTIRDPKHAKALSQLKCPVYMWRKHPAIPNSVEMPLEELLKYFDVFGEGMALDQPLVRGRVYFTNTVSWMLAMAIYEGYKEIHIYGVNMAQDAEYKSQRPSCEFFLGWARGRGIKLYIPPASDLLKTPLLYGYDHGNAWSQKLSARIKELNDRINTYNYEEAKLQQQLAHIQRIKNQTLGAKQDCEYMVNLGPLGVKEDVPGKETRDENSG